MRVSRETALLFGLLAFMGAGWGMTQPLSKIAVSEGYRHFGLIFWQMFIGAVFLGVIQVWRRRSFRFDLPAIKIYLLIALIGTIFPNSATYEAIRHLPSGLISILLAMVPMFAFPVALLLGNEAFRASRLVGLGLGMAGVLLIIGPETSLPDRALVVFVPLALVAPFFYGLEGNIVARWGTAGLDPVEVLLGASALGACLTLPLALATGHFITPPGTWGPPEYALVASSLIHVTVYSIFVWVVGRAGPVFAIQVSYLVTAFGVLWAILILGENYSGWVWGALFVMLCGIALVQPRPRPNALAGGAESGKTHL